MIDRKVNNHAKMNEVPIFSIGDDSMNILSDADNHQSQQQHHHQPHYHPNHHDNYNDTNLIIHINNYQFYAIVIQVILGITTHTTILCSLAITIRRRQRQNLHVINCGSGKQQSQIIPVIDIIIILIFIESLFKILFRSAIQLACFYGFCIIYNDILCYLQGFAITFMHYIHLWTMTLFIQDRYIKNYKQQNDYLCKCTHMVLYLTMSCIVFLITLHLCAPIYGFSNYRFLYDEITCAIDWSSRHSCPFYVYSLILISGPAFISLIYWTIEITYKSYCTYRRNNDLKNEWKMFCKYCRFCCFCFCLHRSCKNVDYDGDNPISNNNNENKDITQTSFYHQVPKIRFSKQSEQIEISDHGQSHMSQQPKQQQQQQNLESVIIINEANQKTLSSSINDDNDNFQIIPASKLPSSTPTSSPSIGSVNQFSMPIASSGISVKNLNDDNNNNPHHRHQEMSVLIHSNPNKIETTKFVPIKTDIIVTSSASASLTSIASNKKVPIDLNDNDSKSKKTSPDHRKSNKNFSKLKRSFMFFQHRPSIIHRYTNNQQSHHFEQNSSNLNTNKFTRSSSFGGGGGQTCSYGVRSYINKHNNTGKIISITICSWIYIIGYLLKLFIYGCHACLPSALFQTMTATSGSSSSKLLSNQFFITSIDEIASTILLPLIMLFVHSNLRIILHICFESLWSSLIRLRMWRFSFFITTSTRNNNSSTIRTSGARMPMDTFN
ncbi:hypothetical protein DERP_000099 [Dermatophagoides pteronyssinus]|uniref:G-protein coupled receptors family 1 profile domain-containing protein n=1 Tax=Dermatophagoides pteronyssinus TaxID=6956 RepID=A0ABQ8IZ66_DERPT|nr:hypothetical protein DERP_000099 [Dermatophagoides pteronyssinus]